MHYVFKYGHVVLKGASHSWAYKERKFNSCHRCQARVNREKWASLPSFYIPLPRLSATLIEVPHPQEGNYLAGKEVPSSVLINYCGAIITANTVVLHCCSALLQNLVGNS